jgi:hypothetical protein
MTKRTVAEMLFRQAEIMFGRDRAEALRSVLEERADHVWRVLSTPAFDEDKP